MLSARALFFDVSLRLNGDRILCLSGKIQRVFHSFHRVIHRFLWTTLWKPWKSPPHPADSRMIFFLQIAAEPLTLPEETIIVKMLKQPGWLVQVITEVSSDGNCGRSALRESRWVVKTGESTGLSIPGAFGDEPKGGALYSGTLSGPKGFFPSGNLGGNAGFLPSHVIFFDGMGGFLFLLIPDE